MDKEKPKEHLRVYDWRTEEWLLIDWYHKLVTSGDMNTTMMSDMRYLSNFLLYFRPKVTLAYASDNNGIWFASWVEPFMAGAFFGLWIRQDKRHIPSAYRLLSEAYDEAFKVFTVLIGISCQEHLRDIHRKMGYSHLGTVPAIWDGNPADVYFMTREMWEAKNGRRRQE